MPSERQIAGVTTMLKGLQRSLQAHGMPAATAARQAYLALYGRVARQAAMFLLLLPLLMIMKRPPNAALPPAGMH